MSESDSEVSAKILKSYGVQGGGVRGPAGFEPGDIMDIVWTILIGFFVGLIARFLSPGVHNPSGFVLTTVLGVVGAAVATWLGQQIGWYNLGEKAGFLGAVVGSVIVLLIWRAFARSGA